MACYLRIWGKFDPEAVAAEAGLEADDYWKEGQNSSRGKVHEDSGMQLCVSDAEFREYRKQFAEAEQFLLRHFESIRAVTGHPDYLEGYLDFGFEQPGKPAFFRRVPASLIRLAAVLRLAIELSFYAVSASDDSADTAN
jgi:hypothetical protein